MYPGQPLGARESQMEREVEEMGGGARGQWETCGDTVDRSLIDH